MIQLWWHFNCILQCFLKKFLELLFSVLHWIAVYEGRTNAWWLGGMLCFNAGSTDYQTERTTVLPCLQQVIYIFFLCPLIKKNQCITVYITVYNMLSIQFYYKAFFRASHQFHEYSLHCIDVNNSIINYYSQISIAR